MFLRHALRASRSVSVNRVAVPMPMYTRGFVSSMAVRSENLSTPEAKQNRIVSILKEKFEPVDLQVQDISGTC